MKFNNFQNLFNYWSSQLEIDECEITARIDKTISRSTSSSYFSILPDDYIRYSRSFMYEGFEKCEYTPKYKVVSDIRHTSTNYESILNEMTVGIVENSVVKELLIVSEGYLTFFNSKSQFLYNDFSKIINYNRIPIRLALQLEIKVYISSVISDFITDYCNRQIKILEELEQENEEYRNKQEYERIKEERIEKELEEYELKLIEKSRFLEKSKIAQRKKRTYILRITYLVLLAISFPALLLDANTIGLICMFIGLFMMLFDGV